MLLRSTLFYLHHGLASLLHDDIGMLAVSNNIGRRSSKRVMLQTVSTLLKPYASGMLKTFPDTEKLYKCEVMSDYLQQPSEGKSAT